MRWTERQRAMLREMGVPAFWPVEPDAVEAAPPSPAAVADVAPRAESPRPAPPPARAVEAPTPVVSVAEPAPVRPAPRATRPGPAPVASPAGRAAPPAEVVLGPRPAGIETMDWPALRTAVAGCQACSLSQSRTQTVFGAGHIEADWMIVGEAPGEQEDRQGEPFVGPAGQLLDAMLRACGRDRQAMDARGVFIANVLKCRPPANRNPAPEEVVQCEPFLSRQVALVRPKLIIAMGRFAVQSLLKTTEPIGRLRGRLHRYEGVPVIVTYHPAYLLRTPTDKAKAWADLCLAMEIDR